MLARLLLRLLAAVYACVQVKCQGARRAKWSGGRELFAGLVRTLGERVNHAAAAEVRPELLLLGIGRLPQTEIRRENKLSGKELVAPRTAVRPGRR